MGKRVYVAVGSTAVLALMKLVDRYKAENLYATTDDQFIGMDTDKGMVDKLRQMDKDNARIHGLQIVDESKENAAVAEVVTSFRREWPRNATIPQSGVGGDRRLSYSTLSWSRDSELGKRIASMATGDEVVLLGTAFGGTATGMFWNLALWLRSKLAKDANGHRPEFYSFVILPIDQKSGMDRYPWGYNFCAFMQDMQAIQAATRLQMQCSPISFRFPFYPAGVKTCPNNLMLLPLWDPVEHGHSDHTYLPCDRLFVVPTLTQNDNAAALIPEVVAEQAFVLGALGGWKDFRVTAQTIDLFSGSAGPKQNLNAKDSAFGGINMVAGWSPKHVALSRRYWQLFQEQYAVFQRKANVSVATPELRAKLRQKMLDLLTDGGRSTLVIEAARKELDQVLNNRRMAAGDTAGQISSLLGRVKTSLDGCPYGWITFSQFVDRCPAFLADVAMNTIATLTDIQTVYAEVRREILQRAGQLEGVRARMLELPARAETIVKQRTKTWPTALPPVLLGGTGATTAEIAEAFARTEKELFAWFCDCCRAEATRVQLPTDAQLVLAMKQVDERCEQMFVPLLRDKCAVARRVQHASSILEDAGDGTPFGELFASLQIPPSHYVNNILQAMKEPNPTAASQVLESGEREGVEALANEARKRGPANPLQSLTLNMGNGKVEAFSHVFAVPDTNEWHVHFCLNYGNVKPLSWRQLIGFSGHFETFKRLAGNRPVGDDQFVEPESLKGDYYNYKAESKGEIQGTWIGTLKLDDDIGRIIQSTYARGTLSLENLSVDAYDLVKNGNPPNALLTLSELMAMGCILGGIDAKMRAEKRFGERACVVSVGTAVRFTISANDAARLMQQRQDGTDRRLAYIPLAWVKPIMAWIDGKFWNEMGMESFNEGLNNRERCLLQRVDLAFTDDFYAGMVQLNAKLDSQIKIEIN